LLLLLEPGVLTAFLGGATRSGPLSPCGRGWLAASAASSGPGEGYRSLATPHPVDPRCTPIDDPLQQGERGSVRVDRILPTLSSPGNSAHIGSMASDNDKQGPQDSAPAPPKARQKPKKPRDPAKPTRAKANRPDFPPTDPELEKVLNPGIHGGTAGPGPSTGIRPPAGNSKQRRADIAAAHTARASTHGFSDAPQANYQPG